MKAIKEEFPNPVLANGRDDYVEECTFQTEFEEANIIVTSDYIRIPIKYNLKCEGIQKLIDAGNAVVAVRVTSNAASYGRLFRFADSNEMTIEIPKFSVVKSIDLQGMIIATQSINQFRCEDEFNADYFGTATFEIRKGDILAIENSQTIDVDASELEKPLSSIFNIKNNDNQEHDIIPNFEGEKIEIYLKTELFKWYDKFKDNGMLRRYANAIVVYPVLIEAVGFIIGYHQQESESPGQTDYTNRRWFRAIEHKASLRGIDFQSCNATTIANILLGNIALDSFRSINDYFEKEGNSGETQMIGGVD